MLFLAGSLAFFLNIAKKNYNIDPPLALHPKQNPDACNIVFVSFLLGRNHARLHTYYVCIESST